jgi:uncharacterized protein (TIGR02145 family)
MKMRKTRLICRLSLFLMFISIISKFSFAQQRSSSIADIDGNHYRTIIIGEQEWMGENLKVTRLNDGTEIMNVPAMNEWTRVTSPAYSWYDNDVSNKTIYGALYNWFAVDSGNLCPVGWRVPDDSDWEVLTDFLGGLSVAGGKLKETGISHWNSPNSGATNESGFSGRPGGYRYGQYWGTGTFYEKGLNGYWWSGTECTDTHSWTRTIHAGNSRVYRSFFTKNKGFSVRCIKNN